MGKAEAELGILNIRLDEIQLARLARAGAEQPDVVLTEDAPRQVTEQDAHFTG